MTFLEDMEGTTLIVLGFFLFGKEIHKPLTERNNPGLYALENKIFKC